MKIEKVIVSKNRSEKIFKKHNVTIEKIEEILLNDNPIYFRTRDNKYLSVGRFDEYITIIFRKEKNNANIITAYQSSKWQIKLYKRKK